VSAGAPILRDIRGVDGGDFDLVIIGGGIYGALCAVEGSHRGLRTLLVEAGDFGAATSFNSLRTIHGGLRYLQRLDFARARRSSAQQRWWFEKFPDLVRPCTCLMPLYGRLTRGRAAFRIAGQLARLAGMRRPPGNGPASSPLLELLSVGDVRRGLPGIPASGLRGGALWHEGFMPEASRVLIECLRWAVAAGGTVLNYVEFVGSQAERRGRARLMLADRPTNATLSVSAAAVINAGGARVDEVARRLGASSGPMLVPTLAWNLLIEAALPGLSSVALTPPGRNSQTYFLQPFHGRALVGTGHAAGQYSASPGMPTPAMLEGMRRDLDAAYPEARLGAAHIKRVLAGVLPGACAGGRFRLATRPRVVRDATAGGACVVHVVGVKFTEAPEVARRAVNCIAGQSLARPGPRPPPGIHWDVLDEASLATRQSLLDLAARESVVYLEDLVERRTNAWCDEAASDRVARLTDGYLIRHAPLHVSASSPRTNE
jgi:glycerol-3-phosphate dehydrogenase